MAAALALAAERVVTCSTCGNVDTRDPCAICTEPRRNQSQICVVEEVGDLWALERATAMPGTYHVLGGTLSALDGIGPDDLHISGLVERAADSQVKEIILALNATVDGQTTSHYIIDRLADCDVTVSQLAHGVPVGGELDYLDDGTLAEAIKARRPF